MQLAGQPAPHWYFIFGPSPRSSLAAQFSLQHSLTHLSDPTQSTLKQHLHLGLVIQSSVQLLRQVQTWKRQITVAFIQGQHSQQELSVRRDYQSIGRLRLITNHSYQSFRRELYPRLIILYNPRNSQSFQIARNYFNDIGYSIVTQPANANQLVKLYPKDRNYVLLNFSPQASELAIIENYFHVKIIHVRHDRTQLGGKEEFFEKEAKLHAVLGKKDYYYSVRGNQTVHQLLVQIGQKICPQLVFFNVHQSAQRQALQHYSKQSNTLLLTIFNIQTALKKKNAHLPTQQQKLDLLVDVIFKNIQKKQIFLQQFPWQPSEFAQLQSRTRPLRLFADCVNSRHYHHSKAINMQIYFLETLRRKSISLDLPFEKQIQSSPKYYVVYGAACAGKTSASKYLCSQFGYKHIEFEPYLAGLKQKLLAPEDGQELPFRKVIAHFHDLVKNSTNPILIDGLAFGIKQAQAWVGKVGSPVVVSLHVEQNDLIKRARKKAQSDANAQITQQQRTKAKQSLTKSQQWLSTFLQKSPLSQHLKVNFSQSLILSQQLLRDTLAPRVYLIQDNNNLAFQNLAIKHNLGYYNLTKYPLREVGDYLKKNNYRDVILANYRQNESQTIAQDIFWIQKNIGKIRYLAVWSGQDYQSQDQPLHLQRPAQPQKPKPAQGEQPPPAEEIKKTVWSIYDYAWTKPGNMKNLSQWFLREKSRVRVIDRTVKDLLGGGFELTLNGLDEDREEVVYERVRA